MNNSSKISVEGNIWVRWAPWRLQRRKWFLQSNPAEWIMDNNSGWTQKQPHQQCVPKTPRLLIDTHCSWEHVSSVREIYNVWPLPSHFSGLKFDMTGNIKCHFRIQLLYVFQDWSGWCNCKTFWGMDFLDFHAHHFLQNRRQQILNIYALLSPHFIKLSKNGIKHAGSSWYLI